MSAERQRSVDCTQPITTDIPCQNCQYNLRGLDKSGLCPECGSPIDVSVRSHSGPASSGRPYAIASLVGFMLFLLSQLQFTLQTSGPALRVTCLVAFFIAGAIQIGVVIGSAKFWRARRRQEEGAMVLALILSAPIALFAVFASCMMLLSWNVYGTF